MYASISNETEEKFSFPASLPLKEKSIHRFSIASISSSRTKHKEPVLRRPGEGEDDSVYDILFSRVNEHVFDAFYSI